LQLVVIGCGKSAAGSEKRGGRPPPSVVVAPVEVRDVPVEVQAPVDLRPLEQVDVGSKVLGYLDAVLVDRGDRVRKGQPIALVRPSDLPGQVAAARGSFAQIESNAALAKLNYARAQKLKPAGVMSDQELEQSEAAVASSEAAQAAARAQLDALAVRLGETRINSPIDGYVATRRLDPGALVGPTAASGAIVTIVRVDRLRAFVNVTERHATAISFGMPVRIELGVAATTVHGSVVRISPAVDPNTRTIEAEVQIANTDGKLRAGMYGRAFIQLAMHRGALVVPAAAVRINNEGQSVFVSEGDHVIERKVTLGTEVDGGNNLEITSGLTPANQVVIAGADGLSNGAKVRVKRAPPGPNGADLPGTAASVVPAGAPHPSGSARP
jgi:RND family efflux transporter MFP subunit